MTGAQPSNDPEYQLRPEARFLLCCARVCLDRRRRHEAATLIHGRLDGGQVLALARGHGLVPLVYRSLQIHFPGAAPSPWMDAFRRESLRIAQHNLRLTAELLHVLELLEKNGVRVLPYKGPTLAASVYGDLALREFADLDLILSERQIAAACEVLARSGYRPESVASEQPRIVPSGVPGQYPFATADGACVLELHTEATLRHFPRRLDFEALWNHSVEMPLSGRTVRGPSKEDLLFLLCVHGAKDYWEQLKWVCDIAELVAGSPELNWTLALEHAQQLKLRRMVLLGLFLAAQFFGVELPADVSTAAGADRGVAELAATVRGRAFASGQNAIGLSERLRFRYLLLEDSGEGIRYALRLATAPTEEDWAALRLPRPLSFLYRIVHVLQLRRKYGIRSSRKSSQASR